MGLKILEIDALFLIRPILERLYGVTTRHDERVPQPHLVHVIFNGLSMLPQLLPPPLQHKRPYNVFG